MESYDDFQPQSEEERRWVEQYNQLSAVISNRLRLLPEEQRLPLLRDSNPSDLSLMNLYMQALKNEDYEACAVAKVLLIERGFKIPS